MINITYDTFGDTFGDIFGDLYGSGTEGKKQYLNNLGIRYITRFHKMTLAEIKDLNLEEKLNLLEQYSISEVSIDILTNQTFEDILQHLINNDKG